MRIGLQSWGSTGDINPFLALAAGLAAAGHEVTLAVTTIERHGYEEFAAAHGFAVRQAGYIGSDVARLNRTGARIFAEKNPLTQMRMMFDELFDPGVPAMFAAATQLAAENELIVGHFIAHPVHLAAELAGRPWVSVALNHGAIPTRIMPPDPFPDLAGWLNLLLWRLIGSQIDRMGLPSVNGLRQTHGARPVKSLRPVWESPLANLIAVSPALCPPRPDWGPNQCICGFFELPSAALPLPADLEAFFAEGEPPIYITFGSMMGLPESSAELEEALDLWLKAAALAGCRAIVQTHWSMAGARPLAGAIFPIERIDHRAIFPRCALVVHHGGAGTCHSACRAGIPSIVVPHIADQYFWAGVLQREGVAPARLARQRLTPRKLAKTIRQTLADDSLRRQAKSLGERMRREDGVAEAVAAIEAMGVRPVSGE